MDSVFSNRQSAEAMLSSLQPVPKVAYDFVAKVLGKGVLENLYAEPPKLATINPGGYRGNSVVFVNG